MLIFVISRIIMFVRLVCWRDIEVKRERIAIKDGTHRLAFCSSASRSQW